MRRISRILSAVVLCWVIVGCATTEKCRKKVGPCVPSTQIVTEIKVQHIIPPPIVMPPVPEIRVLAWSGEAICADVPGYLGELYTDIGRMDDWASRVTDYLAQYNAVREQMLIEAEASDAPHR